MGINLFSKSMVLYRISVTLEHLPSGVSLSLYWLASKIISVILSVVYLLLQLLNGLLLLLNRLDQQSHYAVIVKALQFVVPVLLHQTGRYFFDLMRQKPYFCDFIRSIFQGMLLVISHRIHPGYQAQRIACFDDVCFYPDVGIRADGAGGHYIAGYLQFRVWIIQPYPYVIGEISGIVPSGYVGPGVVKSVIPPKSAPASYRRVGGTSIRAEFID